MTTTTLIGAVDGRAFGGGLAMSVPATAAATVAPRRRDVDPRSGQSPLMGK